MDTRRKTRERLEYWYSVLQTIILSRQNPCTGLIPASVAVTSHGDYRDAWVRDNVYSIYCVFGLALAFRRLDDVDGRAYELEHSVIKCMRGLLFCMMRQAPKVEVFKNTQSIDQALHAKYNTTSGDVVVGDREWGHLQLDATGIFILALAQMTASGMRVVFTLDEVDFIQNLVFYIERAYRTPDYGIWERGDKINHGQPELNSSSIGMVVAALQAINGINLFGPRGGSSSVIHVLPDEITRNWTTLHSALPRESYSKEIDASLLSVVGFPAFAVGDKKLAERTRNEIIRKLRGRYGCKRFLRDGHQAVLEDTSRLHYEPHELKVFEHIESEWPLFFTYLILDGLFRDDQKQVDEYRKALAPCLVDSNNLSAYSHNISPSSPLLQTPNPASPDMLLVPELFIVPADRVAAEKHNPKSQVRNPNENIPLVWAQSLMILGDLIHEELLSPAELDPIGRRYNVIKDNDNIDTVVQVVLLAEDSKVQQRLAMVGIETQTVEQCSPVIIAPPSALKDVYARLGANAKLGLSGRPKRPIGTLGTCKIYRCMGQLYAFIPHFLDREEFYLVSDNEYLVTVFEQELQFVRNHWTLNGRPTMVIVINQSILAGLHPRRKPGVSKNLDDDFSRNAEQKNLLNLLLSLRSGVIGGVRVRLGRMSEVISTACIETLDFLLNPSKGNVSDALSHLRESRIVSGKATQGTTFFTPADGVADEPKRRRTLKRRSSSGEVDKSGSGSKSPLTSPWYSDSGSDGEGYRLRDHEELENLVLDPAANIEPNKIDISPARGIRANRKTAAFKEDATSPTEMKEGRSYTFETTVQRSGSDESISTIESIIDSVQDSVLTLTLHDPSHIHSAISLLNSSVNLYDQVDLLHYLQSCKGLEFKVDKLGTVRTLLEEVYVKAMQLKLWSIVRQAAGLLRKVVNSLTINLTDLVIRQKPVTVGFGSLEYTIMTPMSPNQLAEIIYKHCASDVREAPLVQEVITCLGSFIRSTPNLYEGIMRVRVHFFIIAMREEISRMKACNEEEAVEHLMQLSPFEVKSLLSLVLNARELCSDGAVCQLSAPPTRKGRRSSVASVNSASSPMSHRFSTSAISTSLNMLTVTAQSGGFLAGNFALVEISCDGHPQQLPCIFGRGINVVVLDPVNGSIVETGTFDTHVSPEESSEFAKFIQWLEPGLIVAVAIKDDGSEHLNEDARAALESLGATKARDLAYRDSYCLVGEKGAVRGSVPEAHRKANAGPTENLKKSFDLAARRKKHVFPSGSERNTPIPTELNKVPQLLAGPSNGRWLRRRKNDGALNRVPQDFYPKVWNILSKSGGIRVGKSFLPRDPTVSEKTPEEFNFALEVETILDVIRDPAERQIAVECMMVISKIIDRNPEASPNGEVIDIMRIIREAMIRFWKKWIIDGFSGTSDQAGQKLQDSWGFDKNERMARRLFFDLPQDGPNGTMSYLAGSCLGEFSKFTIDTSLSDCYVS